MSVCTFLRSSWPARSLAAIAIHSIIEYRIPFYEHIANSRTAAASMASNSEQIVEWTAPAGVDHYSRRYTGEHNDKNVRAFGDASEVAAKQGVGNIGFCFRRKYPYELCAFYL